MTTILWTLPFPSSWGGNTLLSELLQRNLALTIEGGDDGDLQIVFTQVEAYRCTYYFARTEEMLIAYVVHAMNLSARTFVSSRR
jgi:hypothetical protein